MYMQSIIVFVNKWWFEFATLSWQPSADGEEASLSGGQPAPDSRLRQDGRPDGRKPQV